MLSLLFKFIDVALMIFMVLSYGNSPNGLWLKKVRYLPTMVLKRVKVKVLEVGLVKITIK